MNRVTNILVVFAVGLLMLTDHVRCLRLSAVRRAWQSTVKNKVSMRQQEYNKDVRSQMKHVVLSSAQKKILLRKLGIVGASTALLLGCGNDMPSFAVESSQASTMTTPSRDIYFGVGCFWHVQHEFVQTEQNLLGRSKDMVTSAAGYAGGTRLGSNQQQKGATAMGSKTVCYHNLLGIADYGKLGHGEVVGMDIPNDAIGAFAKKYFSLFKKGDRPDLGDLGSEYRALIGIPGGVTSPFFPAIEKEAEIIGVSLVKGNGNDADTLRTKTIWVMDSNQFPFHQAEIYHQFHDGFMPGEQYPATYNSLAKNAFRDGRIVPTGCPDV